MAGAGYKLFNTGDVLTAAQVNTYLQEQAVMRFANAAARTTALSGVLSEGMMSYLDDTNSVEVYNGSAWTPVSTSVATSLGYSAGKNVILNSDFRIAQRGTSFTSLTFPTYTLDRWISGADGTPTRTVSQQTFTPGTAPVAGYEGANFLRVAQTVAGSGGSFNLIEQRIEDVRTFAGQTVTLSFWAKADASRTVTPLWGQSFGSGGSGGVETGLTGHSLTTSWQRFTQTFTISSISGKTIGTSSYLYIRFQLPVNTTFTIDIWGVQLEAGSVATAFQTATGTLAGEFQACARYYYRTAGQGNYAPTGISGVGQSTTTANGFFLNPVAMRTNATAIEFSNIAFYDGTNVTALTNMTLDDAGITSQRVGMNAAAGLTQYRPGFAVRNNNAAGYVAFSAEL